MLIGELAQHVGATSKTLRFYEAEGLLPEPERTSSGYRDYSASAVDRVAFIHDAQAAGFTLSQIGQVLDIRDRGEPPCEHVGDLVALRLREVEARIAELQKTRERLKELATRKQDVSPAECDGYCEIIQQP